MSARNVDALHLGIMMVKTKYWKLGILLSLVGCISLGASVFRPDLQSALLPRIAVCLAIADTFYFLGTAGLMKRMAAGAYVLLLLLLSLVVVFNPFYVLPVPSGLIRTLSAIGALWFLFMTVVFGFFIKTRAQTKRDSPHLFR